MLSEDFLRGGWLRRSFWRRESLGKNLIQRKNVGEIYFKERKFGGGLCEGLGQYFVRKTEKAFKGEEKTGRTYKMGEVMMVNCIEREES